ncbi:MAG: flagellar assembly protein FliW [Planctomycetota bacterium]
MQIETQRFGSLLLNEQELFFFPQGLIGLETLRQWALLPDPSNPAVAWLQSVSRGDRALPTVSPRAFVEGYRVNVGRRAVASLHLTPGTETYVLSTVAYNHGGMTTNLRAPIVINLEKRLGVQVVTSDDQPIAHPLPVSEENTLRAAA